MDNRFLRLHGVPASSCKFVLEIAQNFWCTPQVEAQLLATDDRFLRLHGVPAGRALDLFGRTLGAAEGDNQDTPRPGRHPVAKLPPSASALRCAATP